MNRTIRFVAASAAALAFGAANATDYYVSAAGNDSNSGTSAAQAFRTPERALGALSNSDSIFFRANDRFVLNKYLRVTKSGTAKDPIVIGAYQIESDGSVSHRVQANRPVLDGARRTPSLASYAGLIHVVGDHVEVRDLQLNNSGGMGIRLEKMAGGTIRNVDVNWSYYSALQSFKSQDVEILDCDLTQFGQGGRLYGEPVYPAGISINEGTDVRVAGCVVHEGWGEGINSFYGGRNVIIENNTVFAVRNVGVYIDSTQNVDVRNNIILGTKNSAYHRYSDKPFVGPGIALNNESYQFKDRGGSLSNDRVARNIRIYDNLVAGTVYGLAFWGHHPATDWRDVVVAHNTFVDNHAQIHVQGKKYTNTQIANNIFLSLSSGTTDYDNSVETGGITWRNNYWSRGKPPGAVASAEDVYNGLALNRMSGWQSLRSYKDVSWQDFRPTLKSKTIGMGISTFKLIVAEDFSGTPWSSPPDIGALAAVSGEASKPAPRTPRPPFGFRLSSGATVLMTN